MLIWAREELHLQRHVVLLPDDLHVVEDEAHGARDDAICLAKGAQLPAHCAHGKSLSRAGLPVRKHLRNTQRSLSHCRIRHAVYHHAMRVPCPHHAPSTAL